GLFRLRNRRAEFGHRIPFLSCCSVAEIQIRSQTEWKDAKRLPSFSCVIPALAILANCPFLVAAIPQEL
ncbi:hypothetical protein ABT391_36830, partial [Streptomyces jumonjinensis]|uniref:hypothetical protein n=1 Tax=Streptomyces jumonjinensis TaxID=1945 RepID=UPI0033283F53